MANNYVTTESDPMLDVHDRVEKILKDNYVKLVTDLSGKELIYLRVSIGLAIFAYILTGIGSCLAFASGSFVNPYLAFASGCAGILAMFLHKGSLYANSQSQYQESKLRNVLTAEYQFLSQYIKNPLSVQIQPDPTMPDIDTEATKSPVLKALRRKSKKTDTDLEKGLISNKDRPLATTTTTDPNDTLTNVSTTESPHVSITIKDADEK